MLNTNNIVTLYAAGYKPSHIEAAMYCSVKNIIYCLEDGTPENKKIEARFLVRSGIEQYQLAEKTIIVRINSVDTPYWKMDLDYIMYNGISRIRIPKVTSKNDIENILSYINELAITRKINIPKLELMVENLEGLENLPDILNVYKQNIHAITVGGEDLLESLKAKFTNNFDIDVIKKEIVEISHTNNIPCLDTTFMNYKNTNAYKLDCMRSRNLGFDGRSIIHPNQAVDAIEVYSKGHGNV